jgi:hypothetical protein
MAANNGQWLGVQIDGLPCEIHSFRTSLLCMHVHFNMYTSIWTLVGVFFHQVILVVTHFSFRGNKSKRVSIKCP